MKVCAVTLGCKVNAYESEFILSKFKEKGYEIVENSIKKYTDFLFRDYLFVYNSINSTIDIYKLTDLELMISSPIINNQFIDFQFSKDLDTALILVKKNEDKSQTYKILLLKQSQIKDG